MSSSHDPVIRLFHLGCEITTGQRTMSGQNAELSGQNAELSGQILTMPVTFGKRTN